MSDISLSFPLWMVAWFLLGEAAPFLTIATGGLIVAIIVSRNSGRTRRLRWLVLALVVVGSAWLAGVSFWAVGLIDDIRSDLHQAQHHYRLDKPTLVEGLEIPGGSWVWVDEEGRLYGIETDPQKPVSIDGASWSGDIRLISPNVRTASDRGIVKSATLAADAVIQGMPCRAGAPVEFTEHGGDLQHCVLRRRTLVRAETTDAHGTKRTQNIACAPDREIVLRIFADGVVERCVLAEQSTIGSITCAADTQIVFDGEGLSGCTLAAPQRVGPLVLPEQTTIGFSQGRLDRFELAESSAASVRVSGIDVPPGTAGRLCERAPELEWLSVPEDRFVIIGATKLTGRMNFDCGIFEYGALFEDTLLGDRRLPRGAGISREDLAIPSPKPRPASD